MMTRQLTPPVPLLDRRPDEAPRELPVGSELIIAVAFGAVAWWFIVRFLMWLAG